jgi:hypothetical protein
MTKQGEFQIAMRGQQGRVAIPKELFVAFEIRLAKENAG